jgi:phosphoglycerol transferase MdoB-like AlkP superfamily enzyme
MENFEEEYRSKMDALCSKVDVLDYIKSNAYRNVTKANKVVSRPLRSILVTVIPIVLVCCFLFVVSLNIFTSPVNNTDNSNTSGFANALNSNYSESNNSKSISSSTSSDTTSKISSNENSQIPVNNDNPHDSIIAECLNISNTGAKTEDFIIYDGTAKDSILNDF